jgi:hypothetical protein
MSCEDIARDLDAYVDAELAPEEQARIAAHLETCSACAGLVTDLTRLRDTARSLGPIVPPEHVWRSLYARIHDDQNQRPNDAGTSGTSGARTRWRSWLALAAALVVIAAGASIAVHLGSRATPASSVASRDNAVAPDSVKSLADELRQADQLCRDAIAQLDAMTAPDATRLDPAVVATLKRDQGVLDRAIAESRAAFERDPASAVARESLFQALRQKLGLLQDTIALINDARTRQDVQPRDLGRKSS